MERMRKDFQVQDSENISPRKQHKLLARQRSRALLVRRSAEDAGQGVFHDELQEIEREGQQEAKGG